MADRLLESLRHENVSVMYARLPAEFGVLGEPATTALGAPDKR
jgi:hypothetical protein